MSRKSIFNLSCSEAANICDKTAYKESGFWDRLKLKIHLYFCQNCKNYNQKNKKLNELLSKANLNSCSEAEKEVFRERIQKNFSDQSKEK